MKKRLFRIATALVLALVMVAVIAVPVLADSHGYRDRGGNLFSAIADGGSRLLATQGPATGTIPYNWEWVAGDGNFNNPNLQGITAVGLLAAYEKTGNRALLTAAKNAGDTLKQRFAAAPTQRPYAQDVEFLVRLFKDTWDRSYYETAKNWYANVMSDFTAEANVARLITARGSMAGWDVAAHIRAASATGNFKYARDMATEMINRQADWVNVPYPGTTDDYTTLSYGSMLWALGEIGGSWSYQAAVKTYRDALLASQGDDGSWESDYQTTAYVVLGLNAVQGGGKKLTDALSAAGNYLISSQADNGGWLYDTDEYPEVDAECVMALASPTAQGWFSWRGPNFHHNIPRNFHHGLWGQHGPGR